MLFKHQAFGSDAPSLDELAGRARHLHGTVVPVNDVIEGVLREIKTRTAPVMLNYARLRRER